MNTIFGDVIAQYSRKDAIADGVLIDVSQTAKEAGFKVPVAVTQTLYNDYITPNPKRASCHIDIN